MWRRVVRHWVGRGAKKAAGKKEAAPEVLSTDVINIFLDKADPDIKPIDEYPPWVKSLLLPEEHPGLLAQRMYRGEKFELSAGRQKRIRKWVRRFVNTVDQRMEAPKKFYEPKKHENIPDMDIHEGWDEEEDREDYLDPYYRLALGSQWKKEIDRQIRRLRGELIETSTEEQAEAAPAAEKPKETPQKDAKDKEKEKEQEEKEFGGKGKDKK